MNRREFLDLSRTTLTGGLAGTLITAIGGPSQLLAQNVSSSGKLNVPTKDSTTTNYRAQNISWEFAQGRPTKIWGFLPNTFAPPLVVTQNEMLDLTLRNQLASETLGLHWHGIRLPNAMDGVPHLTQAPIALGKSYRYRFSSPDAGTFWYHTHSHSLMQLRMGLLGPLVIREKKSYPVDEDLIIAMNDWSLNRDMQIDARLFRSEFLSRPTAAHQGLIGNVITVNGKVNPVMRVAPYARLRLRFINASTARIFYFDLPNELNPHFLAIDGHPVPNNPYRKIALAPGMRMDIIVDLPKRNGNFQITDNAYGGPEKLFLLQSRGSAVRNQPLTKIQPLPNNPIPKVKPNSAQRIRVTLEGGAMSGMMGGGMMSGMVGMMSGMVTGLFWSINGKALAEDGQYNRPIFQLKKNAHVILNIENVTAFPHPIHLHGHSFYILSRDGVKAQNPRPSDTIFLNPREKTEIGFVADNPGKWMFHCHIIDHQVSGMMGFFEVG